MLAAAGLVGLCCCTRRKSEITYVKGLTLIFNLQKIISILLFVRSLSHFCKTRDASEARHKNLFTYLEIVKLEILTHHQFFGIDEFQSVPFDGMKGCIGRVALVTWWCRSRYRTSDFGFARGS